MDSVFRPSGLALVAGDLACFILALWSALFARSFSPPATAIMLDHLAAFAPLFVVWILVYTIAGLYEGRKIIFARRDLLATLLYAQFANIIIAALFFFIMPLFGIAPKTILFIYLFISFFFVLVWRVFLFPRLGLDKRSAAIVVGAGAEIDELVATLNAAPLSPVRVVERVPAQKEHLAECLSTSIAQSQPQFIIVDFKSTALTHESLPDLYNLLVQGVRFIDANSLYEEVFGRVPLLHVNDEWVARNASRSMSAWYDPIKRIIDIVGGVVVGIISLILYPFIIIAIFIESGGPVFIMQDRVGYRGKIIRLCKFRTMTGNDNGLYKDGVSALRVTRVGAILRTTRMDELPQLWSVVRGDLSLIGPRPEFPPLVAQYESAIKYYNLRHLIRPGLSGWAQLYHANDPHHGAAVEATREKLSYDLYYLKHRSLALDILVALKTITKLLTRSGV